jgi:hypothetical protein
LAPSAWKLRQKPSLRSREVGLENFGGLEIKFGMVSALSEAVKTPRTLGTPHLLGSASHLPGSLAAPARLDQPSWKRGSASHPPGSLAALARKLGSAGARTWLQRLVVLPRPAQEFVCPLRPEVCSYSPGNLSPSARKLGSVRPEA